MAEQKYLKIATDLVNKHRYFLLGKSWCPDVKYTINAFQQNKVFDKVFLYELDKLPDQQEAAKIESGFTELAGKKWVPAIFIDGKYWGNEQTLKQLSAQDKLESTLKELIK